MSPSCSSVPNPLKIGSKTSVLSMLRYFILFYATYASNFLTFFFTLVGNFAMRIVFFLSFFEVIRYDFGIQPL